jgi:antitoxin VapB
MALNIKNTEAHRLAQELAQLTGTSITEAVTNALREEHKKVVKRGEAKVAGLATELDAIARHCSALPLRDTRSAEEILGYDEHGLPH